MGGEVFVALLLPPPCAYQSYTQKKSGHWAAAQAYNTSLESFPWTLNAEQTQLLGHSRDGGELIFLFFRSQIKGGLGGKGWCFCAPDPITDCFFFFFNGSSFGSWGRRISNFFRSDVFFSPGLKCSELVILVWDIAALSDETVASFKSGWSSSENEGIPGNPAGICGKVQKRRSGCLRQNSEATQTFFSRCCVWRQNLMTKTCWFSKKTS